MFQVRILTFPHGSIRIKGVFERRDENGGAGTQVQKADKSYSELQPSSSLISKQHDFSIQLSVMLKINASLYLKPHSRNPNRKYSRNYQLKPLFDALEFQGKHHFVFLV